MSQIDPKQKMAILRALREAAGPVGSAAVARAIQAYGFNSSPRTLRLYLQEMEEEGLVAHAKRGRNGGRDITEKGVAEIKDSLIADRVGYTAAKVDTLSWEMTFNLAAGQGQIVLNSTVLPLQSLRRAVNEMIPVISAGLGMGQYLALFEAGERVGEMLIPPGNVGVGTLCSITVNGVLLSARIPTVSRFGGVLEIRDHVPVRFTDVINYDGTSLDPLEIFIKAGLTSVRNAARRGAGRIGASFREVPSCALAEVYRLRDSLAAAGLGGILMIGKPNQSLLGFPVPDGRTGVIVAGGLNPAAAVEEAGIPTTNTAFSTLYEFEKLVHVQELSRQVRRMTGP